MKRSRRIRHKREPSQWTKHKLTDVIARAESGDAQAMQLMKRLRAQRDKEIADYRAMFSPHVEWDTSIDELAALVRAKNDNAIRIMLCRANEGEKEAIELYEQVTRENDVEMRRAAGM